MVKRLKSCMHEFCIMNKKSTSSRDPGVWVDFFFAAAMSMLKEATIATRVTNSSVELIYDDPVRTGWSILKSWYEDSTLTS